MSAVMPYVSPEPVAKSRDIVRGTWPQALCALGGALAVTGIGAALGFWSAGRLAAATLLLVLLVGLLGWRFHVRAGGVTGDFLGATEQLGEIAVYATLAWSLSDG
jgi:adenosylcobinamide-GDP ribazoletransferase